MVSHEIGTLDVASLERFQTELIEAGFEPQEGTGRRRWIGPVAGALADLTTATVMTLAFVDGWPFRPPRLLVEGLEAIHYGPYGEVCLWQQGTGSGDWLTLDGFMRRIDEWRKRIEGGFGPEDFALDAHLMFDPFRAGCIATVNLADLRLDGRIGELDTMSGEWDTYGRVLSIVRGVSRKLEGRWYYLRGNPVPPRTLDDVKSLLSVEQSRNFERRLRAVVKRAAHRVFLFAWDREYGREVLILCVQNGDDGIVAEAVEVAPTDPEFLKLRAGPDAEKLASKKVVIFGAGALGSNIALRLCEAGLGLLVLVDNAQLRPGDVVRHAASNLMVGMSKVAAVEIVVKTKAPWTEVVRIENSPWDPKGIAKLIRQGDLTIDATGFTSFANLLSVVSEAHAAPIASGALYRGGAVVRVRRQALKLDTPLHLRSQDGRYPSIPVGSEPFSYEPGCTAPVNNASPVAVARAAVLVSEVAIDFLTGRCASDDEIVEVLRPLEEEPFDQLGRIVT